MVRPKTTKCGSCMKTVKEDGDAIQCDYDCELWYHIQCVGIDEKEYLRLSESDEEWVCDRCSLIKSNSMLKNEIQNLNEVILALQTDLEQLQNRYESERRQNNNLSEICIIKEEEIVRLKQQFLNRPTVQSAVEWTSRIGSKKTSTGPFSGLSRSLTVDTLGMNSFPPLVTQNRFACLRLDVEDLDDTSLNNKCHSTPAPNFNRKMKNYEVLSYERDKQDSPSCALNVATNRDRPKMYGKSSTSKREVSCATNKKQHRSVSCNNKIKVHHYADSQGRSVYKELINGCDFNVTSVVKPGAKFRNVMPEKIDDLGQEDFLVIQAGSNDVSKNEANDVLEALRNRLDANDRINIIVFSIPHRHDLEDWSCVNNLIKKTNVEIHKICNLYSNCSYIDIGKIGKRFHTAHGLHLNRRGKRFVSDKIIDCIVSTLSNKGLDNNSFLG